MTRHGMGKTSAARITLLATDLHAPVMAIAVETVTASHPPNCQDRTDATFTNAVLAIDTLSSGEPAIASSSRKAKSP